MHIIIIMIKPAGSLSSAVSSGSGMPPVTASDVGVCASDVTPQC